MNQIILIAVLLVSILTHKSLAQDGQTVTCGSTIKLIHVDTKLILHSHSIAWGSGSGQQSVTATNTLTDPNSLWIIKEEMPYGKKTCELATPIPCGTKVSLEHVGTRKNLHSHLFRSPLSGNQEVSGFGENGFGDTGDNWVVECESKADKYWQRVAKVTLKHADTSKYLSTGEMYKFDQRNCGHQCPIMVCNL